MSKSKYTPRLVIALRRAELQGERLDRATELVDQVLSKFQGGWFKLETIGDYVMYVVRCEKVGKLVESVIEDVRSQYSGSELAFRYVSWVNPPKRSRLFRCRDKGVYATLRPGDDLSGIDFVQTAGLHRIGQLVRPRVTPHFGNIQRVLFQGRSRSVYKAKRLFKHHFYRIDSAYHGDFMGSLHMARAALDEHTVIHLTNTYGDLYTLTSDRLLVNSWGNGLLLGEQAIFEFKDVPLNYTINNLYDQQREGDSFDIECRLAAAQAYTQYYRRDI